MERELSSDLEVLVSGNAHTDVKNFLSHIPEDECLVAPIADYNCIYKLFPGTRNPLESLSSIRVRHGNIYKNKPFEETNWFQVNDSYITIYTNTFSQFICTSCERICYGQGKAFVFGNLIKYPTLPPFSSVRLYVCSPLYNIKDYRNVRQWGDTVSGQILFFFLGEFFKNLGRLFFWVIFDFFWAKKQKNVYFWAYFYHRPALVF